VFGSSFVSFDHFFDKIKIKSFKSDLEYDTGSTSIKKNRSNGETFNVVKYSFLNDERCNFLPFFSTNYSLQRILDVLISLMKLFLVRERAAGSELIERRFNTRNALL